MPTAPEGPRKQHRNSNKTKTYVTLTSLRQFCRVARHPVSDAGAADDRRVVASHSTRLFLPTSSPS